MIKLLASRVIETSLNNVFAFNSSASHVLSKHSGKVLKLILSDFNESLYFIFRSSKIYVYTDYSDEPNVVIQGSALTFLKQLRSTSLEPELFIEGDIELAQDFQTLLKSTDVNWEEIFAHFLGDAPSHQLNNFLKKIKQSVAYISQRSADDLVEYLQEEKEFLPPREEVEDFYEDLIQFRNRIDIAEAKWNRFMEKKQNEVI